MSSLDTIPSLDTTLLFSGVPVGTGNTRPDLYSGRNIWWPVASAGHHPDGSRAQDGKVSQVAITAIWTRNKISYQQQLSCLARQADIRDQLKTFLNQRQKLKSLVY